MDNSDINVNETGIRMYFVFMPPTPKKLRGHIGLGLSVRNNFLAAEKLKNGLC